MKNLLIADQNRGSRFLVETKNITGELEVATPELGVVLIGTDRRPHRWHKRTRHVFKVGDKFFGERIVRIKRTRGNEMV